MPLFCPIKKSVLAYIVQIFYPCHRITRKIIGLSFDICFIAPLIQALRLSDKQLFQYLTLAKCKPYPLATCWHMSLFLTFLSFSTFLLVAICLSFVCDSFAIGLSTCLSSLLICVVINHSKNSVLTMCDLLAISFVEISFFIAVLILETERLVSLESLSNDVNLDPLFISIPLHLLSLWLAVIIK